jgi:DNA-binding response OmpR family regulator
MTADGVSRILIVDDEPFNVDYLEQELADLGYDTVTARNGKEALEKVESEAPDLILLDVMMPVLDGLTVCRELKSREETRLIPIVIMTALDGIENRIKGIEAGADDFLTKPVNQRELAARIRTALALKHAIDRRIGSLRRMKDHLEKFVPEAVKRLIASDPEAPDLDKRERDVSVLFLDISGYGQLCEALPRASVNALVEDYFSAFLDCIQEANGDINETAGDGFMAVFQAAEHARGAVDAAVRLLALTDSLNQTNPERPLLIHIGVNSGAALVGSTRFEGTRGSRWTFTASGSVTNVAARLAAAAEAGQILAGAETVRRLDDRYKVEALGRERLKNIAEEIEIYRICSRS